MPSGEDWSEEECLAAARAYLDYMFSDSPPHKTTVYSSLAAGALSQRNEGAIERKFQNISSVLEERGLPWVSGLKPQKNMQGTLRDAVDKALSAQRTVNMKAFLKASPPHDQNFRLREFADTASAALAGILKVDSDEIGCYGTETEGSKAVTRQMQQAQQSRAKVLLLYFPKGKKDAESAAKTLSDKENYWGRDISCVILAHLSGRKWEIGSVVARPESPYVPRVREFLTGDGLHVSRPPVPAPRASSDVEPLNRILYGPPGTGKTFEAVSIAVRLCGDSAAYSQDRSEVMAAYRRLVEAGQVVFVTFHQSFAYEDFVEGIRAEVTDKGLTYLPQPGVFRRVCTEAGKADKPHVIIIDEINRANIAKVLGELITLLEPDKRLGAAEERTVTLPYSRERFGIPPNLFIVGTMNTADRSIAFMDIALRRRFDFVPMHPVPEAIEKAVPVLEGGLNPAEFLRVINRRIEFLLDQEHLIGHAYLLHVTGLDSLKSVVVHKILPLLEEYFEGDWSRVALVLGCGYDEDGRQAEQGTAIVRARVLDATALLGDAVDYDNRVTGEVNEAFLSAGGRDALPFLQRVIVGAV